MTSTSTPTSSAARARLLTVTIAAALSVAACTEDPAADDDEAGADTGETDTAAELTCPETIGPSMIELPEGYCIDSTEVTREHYAAWLDTSPSLDSQPPSCAWNDALEPTCGWPPGNDGQKPVVCVDWCDARAYCEAAGKRLCGKIGGGAAGYDDYADHELSQWFNACTSGGRYDYTYGDTLDGAACRGADEDMWAWIEVGSLASCQSPDSSYAGVFDLSGNVMEWEDACDGDQSAEDSCRLRGGSFNNSGTGLRCDMGENLLFARSAFYVGVGFRCCAD